jgi:hypothetical protein
MSNRKDDEQQPSVLSFIAAGATAVAVIVGVVGAVGAFLTEREPVTTGGNATTEGSAYVNRNNEFGSSRSSSSRTSNAAELQQWIRMSAANLDTAEEENVPEALLCKICEARQITHVLCCGHTLCKLCAVSVLKNTRTCPFDRATITSPPQKLYM